MHQARRVEQLHEPLVSAPCLRRREVQVLVEHRRQTPLLQLPQASDDAASPVLKENTRRVSISEIKCYRSIVEAKC